MVKILKKYEQLGKYVGELIVRMWGLQRMGEVFL